MYGTPYLKYREFETFDDISKFLINKSIVNYSIFEKMSNKKEVEMIYLNNDIRVLEERIDKAIEYINKITLVILKDYEKYKDTPLKNTMIGKELLEILGGE